MKLRIYDEKLRIDLESLEKILAVKRPLEILLKHISEATTEAPKTSWREISNGLKELMKLFLNLLKKSPNSIKVNQRYHIDDYRWAIN
jgi:hypothetical protein